MPDEKKVSSDLDDAIDSVAKLASGLAGKVFNAPSKSDTPVVDEDVDEALDEVGAKLGGLLAAAGEAMREHSTAPDEALGAAADKMRDGHQAPKSETWSPLVQGASSFLDGFGKMSADLLDSMTAKNVRPGEE